LRVFFALWPDAGGRAELARWSDLCRQVGGGRTVVPGNLHATLAFVGEVESEDLALLARVMSALRPRPFDLRLDRIGYWRHNRIAYAGASAAPSALLDLASSLARGLRDAGFRMEERALLPHVTLARNARDPGEVVVAPLAWRSSDIALVESAREGGRLIYRPLQRWTLAA